MKKTKIIATISSRQCDPPFLQKLYEAGMDAVRMNTAHLNMKEASLIIDNVRAVSDRIPIMIDTKGPEMRTTECASDIPVRTGDTIHVRGDKDGETTAECVCVNYDRFAEELSPGDLILIDDGDIELSVLTRDPHGLTCEVRNDGLIRGRKSINLPGVKIRNLPSLSAKDIEFVKFAADRSVEFIAHSFVRRKEDVITIQEILDEKNSRIKIIAKIENREGVDNIDEILDHAYGAMIARGDLAIEIPAQQIPLIQKNLVKKCIERRKPVIIATQMLQSMIHAPRPTRAEVSDVANACLDGTDAVMLSGETASGKYPLESIQMMATIADEIESSRNTFLNTPYETENTITSYLAKAAVKASMRLNTRALIADTISGRTIRSLAAYRGLNPVFAQCYDQRVKRELAISYGVHANFMEPDLTSHEFLQTALIRLLREGHFNGDNLITVLAGNFGSDYGASFIEINTAENMLKRK
ncbi:MAG: pyruvate kinase [Desulfobacterales bacterium]